MLRSPPPAAKNGYSLADLLRRGWTKSIIRTLLGPPDEMARNPHYLMGGRMKVYSHGRVHAAEQLPDFKELTAKLPRNKGTKPIQRRRRALAQMRFP